MVVYGSSWIEMRNLHRDKRGQTPRLDDCVFQKTPSEHHWPLDDDPAPPRPSQSACAKSRHHHRSRRRWRMSRGDIIFRETNDVTHAKTSRQNASWSVGRQPSTQWNSIHCRRPRRMIATSSWMSSAPSDFRQDPSFTKAELNRHSMDKSINKYSE